MAILLALLVGALYTAGFYLLLRRTLVKLALGLVLLGHAANLLIFVTAGLMRDAAPLLPAGVPPDPRAVADPLPQALVLTAIVISFGVLAFFLALVWRVQNVLDTDDVDRVREEEL